MCHLAALSDGDARIALNGLHTALRAATSKKLGIISLKDIQDGLERNYVQYDRTGDYWLLWGLFLTISGQITIDIYVSKRIWLIA